MATRSPTAPLAEGYPTVVVEHRVNGSKHLRPEGFFAPLCGMRKPVRETGKLVDSWRTDKGTYCGTCERAAKFFGYLK